MQMQIQCRFTGITDDASMIMGLWTVSGCGIDVGNLCIHKRNAAALTHIPEVEVDAGSTRDSKGYRPASLWLGQITKQPCGHLE
uniref:Uncharacterized protein n=1 Tax=Mesocestoides corti TaxID=53468 RepID=A0A5K3FYH5_MESCO